MAEADGREQIAIIGMAGRFPGAVDVDQFWANLRNGVESIRAFTDAELSEAGADTSEPGFVNAGSVMDGIDMFDAGFFGMSRREAELTDPQHRVFLECAWTAIEHAGYEPGADVGRIGVFGGVGPNTYFRRNVVDHADLLARTGDYPLLLATEREYAITRVAYKLGLRGPAISLNTACSTGAVAVHLAVQSLLSGESDLALAGACRIRVPATAGYVYQEDGIPSPDGHCRAFDADARGTVLASGAAVVVLKRLSDAIRDDDTVYAVIKGSAVNNDGAAKIGYTAPSIEGQTAVIEEALAVAEVDADTIGMVEAHGTGTSLGDPIEVAALTQAYRRDTSRRQYCAIGSLKSNIGHLDAAAGVAGIIKAALSLHHEEIPPSLNFNRPNPQIDFSGSPFFVNTELRAWKRTEQPRRAAVSAFGLGGTNAHLVLEEAPERAPAPAGPRKAHQIVTLSAKSHAALEAMGGALADHLERHPDLELADVGYSSQLGRARMPHRRSFVASTVREAMRLLREPDPLVVSDRVTASDGARVAFMFPGQGAQHPGMGAGLYQSEPVFKAALDECARILAPILGRDLLEVIYPEADKVDAAAEELGDAALAQPATFAIQYALARLWMSWGVQPSAMVGHSLGEFAAACLGGVFSLQDALRLVAERGRLMQAQLGGGMLAIMLEPEAVIPLLDAATSLAAINAPAQCVASGPEASISRLEEQLVAADVEVQRLPIALAAHSPMMDPIVAQFRELVRGTARGPLTVPIVSTVTGTWAAEDQLADPDYWATHLQQTVRFVDAANRLLDQPDMILLEVGPGQTLASLVRQYPEAMPDRVVLSSLRHRRQQVSDEEWILRALGQVWGAGGDVDWPGVHGGRRRRVVLPTYPFDHERYWIDPIGRSRGAASAPRPTRAAPPDPEPVHQEATVARTENLVADGPEPATELRKDRIIVRLASILSELSGVDPSALDPSASFADLGFDSLFLTQANAQFRKQFGVRITFRQIFEEAPSIDSLAGFIDGKLAPEAFPGPQRPVVTSPTPADAAGHRDDSGPGVRELHGVETEPASTTAVERLIREQLRVMERQIELMRSGDRSDAVAPALMAPTPSVDAPAPFVEAPAPSSPRTHYLATRDQGHRPAGN
ncbi:MAG TPA: beta-ketoacyl synthase N-terminal-like domain-containing protein, partial [Candidatus Limnocylindrales bacterium]